MFDFEKARRMMVDNQVRTVDVTDPAVTSAMLDIPREKFVPSALRPFAYLDEDLLVREAGEEGPARYLMEPAPFARLVQAAEIGRGDVVLDVGCATGYSSAVLARLASSVVAVEPDPHLAAEANRILTELGVDNVAVVGGSLEEGYPSEGPYDAILLEGAVEEIPQAMFDQLKEGGRLLAVVGYGRAASAMVFLRTAGAVSGRSIFNAHVQPLPGFRRPPAFVF
jgi:protein-L-isoaspartate(D-aspartate) O-methyltransferase